MGATPCSAARLNQLTDQVIAAAIAVHRALGPGLLEGAYIACLCYELAEGNLRVAVQKPIPLVYKKVRLDCAYKADLIVEDSVIVEVKAQEFADTDPLQAAADVPQALRQPCGTDPELRGKNDAGRH